jgi:hypothetical protein
VTFNVVEAEFSILLKASAQEASNTQWCICRQPAPIGFSLEYFGKNFADGFSFEYRTSREHLERARQWWLLFAGDVEAEGEDGLVAAGVGHADVVKVAHHGSPTSSTAGFIAATHPALAVISCGPGNPFGFPAPGVVARWRGAGADVARTDTDGAITVTIDDRGALAIDRFAP